MQMIDRRVDSAGEGDDAAPHGVGQPTRRGPATVAVDQGRRSVLSVGAPEASNLANRAAKESGGLRHVDLSALQSI